MRKDGKFPARFSWRKSMWFSKPYRLTSSFFTLPRYVNISIRIFGHIVSSPGSGWHSPFVYDGNSHFIYAKPYRRYRPPAGAPISAAACIRLSFLGFLPTDPENGRKWRQSALKIGHQTIFFWRKLWASEVLNIIIGNSQMKYMIWDYSIEKSNTITGPLSDLMPDLLS